jgi:hypothetical protein
MWEYACELQGRGLDSNGWLCGSLSTEPGVGGRLNMIGGHGLHGPVEIWRRSVWTGDTPT